MRFISSITTAKRKFALVCALLLMLAPLGALGEYVTDDALHLGILSVTTTRVNPLDPMEREFMSLTDLVYEGLMTIDDDYQPQCALAERYACSTNGKTWYFYLREGVTFHDGTPLTAQDVVATVQEILRMAGDETAASKGRYASLQYFVKSISASDSLTVVITTDSRASYAFLYGMTFPILKASEVQADNPAGTGPYYVDIFEPTDYMLLSAYTGWWQNTPDYSQVMVTFHQTNRELISSYEYNRVDAVLTRAITAAQYRSGVSSYNIDYRTAQLETLLMNNTVRELSDVRVRKAIRYAVDIDDIVKNVYYGMVSRTDTPLFPSNWTYWQGADGVHEYNLQKAVQLLDESGWIDSDDEDAIRDKIIDGKQANLILRFYVYEEQDNSVRVEVANRIAEALQSIGIGVNVSTMTFSEVKEKLAAGSFDLCLAAFNMDAAPDPGFLLIPGNVCNYGRYKSETMRALFKTLRTSLEFSAYSSSLQQIQSLFWEDCPFMCLYYRNGAILTRKVFTDARDVREPEVLRGIQTFQKQ